MRRALQIISLQGSFDLELQRQWKFPTSYVGEV